MTTEQAAHIPQMERPIVFIVKPRCPSCGSDDIKTRRSAANGDGTTTRNVICKSCRLPFIVCVE